MDEVKLIAAILAAGTAGAEPPPRATHLDPARNIAVQVVTRYERILEELRARGHR
jgi:hypothetical protein